MAFLRGYGQTCDAGCGASAKEELLTFRNELHGRYCKRCAPRILTRVIADEQRLFAAQRRAVAGPVGVAPQTEEKHEKTQQ